MAIIKTLIPRQPFLNCKCTLYKESEKKLPKVRIYPHKNEKNIKLTSMSVGKYWLCVKEGRVLNNDERVGYKDNNRENYDFDNIFITDKNIRYNSVEANKELGQVPYQDYYIGKEHYPEKNEKCYVMLYDKKDTLKTKNILRSSYRFCLNLGRLLEKNERIIYKDGNRFNDDLDNLKLKIFEEGKMPFQDYYIGNIYHHSVTGVCLINLYHKYKNSKSRVMTYSRYIMCLKEKRILNKDEKIRHKDGNSFNDDDDNLEILSKEKHREKLNKDRSRQTPTVTICCDGCSENFDLTLSKLRYRIKRSQSKNIFCSDYCLWVNKKNFVKKMMITYKCKECNVDIPIPENAKLNIPFCSNKCATSFKKKGK